MGILIIVIPPLYIPAPSSPPRQHNLLPSFLTRTRIIIKPYNKQDMMSNYVVQNFQDDDDEDQQFHNTDSPNKPSENASSAAAAASKNKRNLPGNPDPDAEAVALSPITLMATNRYICEVCHKGFQRDQNLQLHRRGHNLPWKIKQRPTTQVAKKRVYVCPEPSCVHHDPTRALGDLTGIKKHFCRKHGEKKWKCDK